MKIAFFILFSLFINFSSNANSVDIKLNCEASKPHEFRAAGYLVGNPKVDLKGAAKKADEITARKILEIVNPAEDQESTYQKAFDFGNFRFVRNKEASRGWDVYERKSTTAAWFKLSPTPERIRIYQNQNLWVKTFAKNQLLVMRISGDDQEAKDFYIHTQTNKITIKGSNRAVDYLFDHCIKTTPTTAPPNEHPAKT